MTELEKQEILRNFSIVVDYINQQLDDEESKLIQSTLLYNLTSTSDDGLSIPTLPFPIVAPSTLAERETQLSHLTQTVEYIRHTEATALTDESIRSFAQALQ
jgi:hypothetical protein